VAVAVVEVTTCWNNQPCGVGCVPVVSSDVVVVLVLVSKAAASRLERVVPVEVVPSGGRVVTVERALETTCRWECPMSRDEVAAALWRVLASPTRCLVLPVVLMREPEPLEVSLY
jgi:hypothetical protein